MKIRLNFDLDSLPIEAQSINVYEYGGADAPLLIASVAVDRGKDYIELEDSFNSEYSLFAVSYMTSEGESPLSSPFPCEHLDKIITKVALAIGDTRRGACDDEAFSDQEYIGKIKAASRRFRQTESLAGVKESEVEIIAKLVQSSCCYDLAFDNAKFTKVKLPDGVELNRGDRVKYYLDIAKSLENYFSILKTDWTDENGSLSITPGVTCGRLGKKSYLNRGVNKSRFE